MSEKDNKQYDIFALAEVGYTWKDYSVFYLHIVSTSASENNFKLIGIKYRFK